MAIPNMWRTKKQRYSLQGEICPTCASAIFPPRSVCPQCGSAMDAAHGRAHHAAIANPPIAARPALIENPAGDD
jgi:predicted amidophosphoribosyltransferase